MEKDQNIIRLQFRNTSINYAVIAVLFQIDITNKCYEGYILDLSEGLRMDLI